MHIDDVGQTSVVAAITSPRSWLLDYVRSRQNKRSMTETTGENLEVKIEVLKRSLIPGLGSVHAQFQILRLASLHFIFEEAAENSY